jgi:hypothetical protein
MPARATKPSKKKAASAKFVLGRGAFAKISAVEGIALTPAMKKRAADFERRGLTPAERRREILKVYRKKA